MIETTLIDIEKDVKNIINYYNIEENTLEDEIYELLESYIEDNMIDDFRILSIEDNFIRQNDEVGVETDVKEVTLSITLSADPNNFKEVELFISSLDI